MRYVKLETRNRGIEFIRFIQLCNYVTSWSNSRWIIWSRIRVDTEGTSVNFARDDSNKTSRKWIDMDDP